MKTLKELRDEKAKEYFVFGLELTPDRYLPMAFKAGFDTALEELSKSAGGEIELPKKSVFVGENMIEFISGNYVIELELKVSALRLRIAEIEGEK